MIRWQVVAFIITLVAISLHFLISIYSFQPIYHVAAQDIPLLLVLIVCGTPLLCQILLKLLKRDFGADFLAVIAILTGIYLGEYLAATIVMLMIASGQMFESYALRKASSVLLALAERMPSHAHRKVGNDIEDIAIHKIQIKDYIVIYPHEVCPVDGIVIEGHGFMDESYLTGEPYLVSKASGVVVLSGSINGETLLIIRAEKRPEDSRYAKIMQVMKESEQQRPKIRRLGDQLGAIFAPLTLIIAFCTWYLTQDAVRFLAVLVIATPCPLLIAIPITIISAISLAARKGIIIKDPVILERLPTCKTAIFDKTGTLTYGQAELIGLSPFPGFDIDAVLQQAASLERFSRHPLASAVVKAAKKLRVTLSDVEQVNESSGEGLKGIIKGKTIQITNRGKLAIQYPDQAASLPPMKRGMECIILIDGKVAALFHFRDTLRAEGQSFISHLAPIHHFKKLMIVSGDRLAEVSYIAQQLGIQKIYASQTPEQKLEIVRQETAKAPTLFMGDGLNDAPALAAATVGLAFGQHNITATEAAGAVILESSLSKVDELIHISVLMRQIALLSAGGGMLFSLVGMYFAAIGVITPVMGALLQEGIDVIAILNALRLTWKSKIIVDIKG
ncbi:MAG: cadmium-translocating P-type ATPase [Alphaproteobacteria bacterium]|nr:cadmium-translocating P-type ATPase [Alphaproteobacteria bacterium]MBP9776360.1 cadmium-translocating P-type ATPase [Alphaproteobacteria bacterium]